MRIVKEPFFHFIIIGLIIFVIDSYINREANEANEIIITQDDVDRLTAVYTQNWNQQPDKAIVEKLIDDYINSEIYYNEALKLNLDHNDEIIKRRLRQKYEFVAHDLADLAKPSDEILESYYHAHADQYSEPVRLTFYQYYVNPDLHRDAQQRATGLYKTFSEKLPDQLNSHGDNSHLEMRYKDHDRAAIARLFGSEFSDVLFEHPAPGWQKSIRSGYGYHIVYIEEVLPEALLSFVEVQQEVLQDWQQDNRDNLTGALIKELRRQYKIVRLYGD